MDTGKRENILVWLNAVAEFPTDSEQRLSYKGKLRLIDRELGILLELCGKAGIGTSEVRRCCSPVEDLISKANRQKKLKYFQIFVTLLLVSYLFVNTQFTFKALSVVVKLSAISVLPYYNWQPWFYRECLMENPYYKGGMLKEEDCLVCEEVHEVERVRRISSDDLFDDLVYNDIPVVVLDGIEDWPIHEIVNHSELLKLYAGNPVMTAKEPCFFVNYPVRTAKTLVRLMRALYKGGRSYNALWEHCDKREIKVLRRLYRRPYFLPLSVEYGTSVWVAISNGEIPDQYNSPYFVTNLALFVQVKGTCEVLLVPHFPCNDTCETLRTVLEPGQTLMYSGKLWTLKYKPIVSGETIMLGVGAQWDS